MEQYIDVKETIRQHCLAQIEDKIIQIRESVKQAEDSLFGETKSSAGDKYETSREMIQQDLDRLQSQLVEASKDKSVLDALVETNLSDSAIVGSLVQTDTAFYYIAVGVGRVQIEGQQIYAISAKSPVGQLMLGKRAGEFFSFNEKKQQIQKVV